MGELLSVAFYILVIVFAVKTKKKKKEQNMSSKEAAADTAAEIYEAVRKAAKEVDDAFEADMKPKPSKQHKVMERDILAENQRKPKKKKQHQKTQINERARQNIAKQDEAQTKSRVENEEHELTMDEIIRRKEEELRFGMTSDHQEIPEENHLMEIVEDLMVKGPDTSIPNERDFIGESMSFVSNL